MAKNPTPEDAQIIMRLYDLRREAEMRKARQWFARFWPHAPQDVIQVLEAINPQENAWFRQVTGYWEMAASFVMRGVLNEDLFFDSSAEMWFVLAKIHPFLKEIREKTQLPTYLSRIEQLATRTEEGRGRLELMLKRAERQRAAAAAEPRS
ncbi:MAG: hypothetical protein JO159_17005 [Acidobacteria bacterium]|nr:hypothetical protein [Acidobacteriota bacterium]MBV9624162.1 hypothetical protein [Acidobacteriota bacterium]